VVSGLAVAASEADRQVAPNFAPNLSGPT
jgi:hypothetical protein